MWEHCTDGLKTQSPKFVRASLQSRLKFFHNCKGISSYKGRWMIFNVIKGSSCETWSGILGFPGYLLLILLGNEGQEILLLLFSSLESHAIVSGYCNHLALTILFLMQGQCSYSNFIWLELKNLVNIKCLCTSCIIPLIKRKKRDPQLLLCWNTWPSLHVSTDQK